METTMYYPDQDLKQKQVEFYTRVAEGFGQSDLFSTYNGKILYSGLFEDVFVQPAAHDAGCALGAALYRYYQLNPQHRYVPLQDLYWGNPVQTDDSILQVLDSWKTFLQYERVENITAKTAQLLADGAVIGWVQGRSEFGPRALGN